MNESKHTLSEMANGAAVVAKFADRPVLPLSGANPNPSIKGEAFSRYAIERERWQMQNDCFGPSNAFFIPISGTRAAGESALFSHFGSLSQPFLFQWIREEPPSRIFCYLKAACGREAGCGCYSDFSGISAAAL
jgi:hypothetical protein